VRIVVERAAVYVPGRVRHSMQRKLIIGRLLRMAASYGEAHNSQIV
jgi:hypothetical protein